jgi:hypothetical protein
MQKFLMVFFLVLFSGSILAIPAPAINVTFHVNSSTVEGFTDSTDIIQIRGEVGGSNALLKWNNQSVVCPNFEGDYWQVTIPFPDSTIGDLVKWKIGATRTDIDGNVSDFWEAGGNREFVVPATDTVLGLAYISNDWDPPYTPSDSIDVYFRVNMLTNAGFKPATQILSLVGGFPSPTGQNNMWSPGTYRLVRETATSNYWGYHLKLAQSSDHYPGDAGGRVTVDTVLYRFAIGTDWGNNENLAGKYIKNKNGSNNENRVTQVYHDTTLAWKYWNDVAPGKAGSDSVNILFRADLTNAINDQGFSIGDTVLVRWGYNNTAVFGEDTLVNEFGGNYYSVQIKAREIGLNKDIAYQYYVMVNGVPDREIYYDFNDPNQTTQEKRKILVPAVKPELLTVNDDVNSISDPHRMPKFRNNDKLSNDVTVNWEVDLRPAFFQVKLKGSTLEDIQGDFDVAPGEEDSILVWGVWMNGPAVGGWSNPEGTDWGADLRANLLKKLYDDATNGDVTAGDSIFTRQVFYSPDSNDIAGQIYKFGIYGGDNEAGSQGYGNNHLANIDDAQSTFTIHTQFGSINPNFYTAWDFDLGQVSAIEDLSGIVIRRPDLKANYPNPFNPATTLTFELPRQMEVKLVIYNVLGQKVYTVLDGMQRAGIHQVLWNGIDESGRPVSSGVYFYQMKTENFEKTLKMVLVK